eukprot:4527537-Amphidinium_carterae.1
MGVILGAEPCQSILAVAMTSPVGSDRDSANNQSLKSPSTCGRRVLQTARVQVPPCPGQSISRLPQQSGPRNKHRAQEQVRLQGQPQLISL